MVESAVKNYIYENCCIILLDILIEKEILGSHIMIKIQITWLQCVVAHYKCTCGCPGI